jgi:pimeloyl-ACP methyl ester carboxylesterase
MFRNLIPELRAFRVIAPDLPGFGFRVHLTIRRLLIVRSPAEVMGQFVVEIGLQRFAIYVFDYGAPVGFRLALQFPDRVSAIVTQNGNAYLEGLSEAWSPIRSYWEHPTRENRDALRQFCSVEITRFQYYHGVEDAEMRIAPEALALDQALLDRPQSLEIQLDLFDYKQPRDLSEISGVLSTHRLPTLAVWDETIPSSCLREPKRIGETIPTPGSSSTIPAILRSRHMRKKSAVRSALFLTEKL